MNRRRVAPFRPSVGGIHRRVRSLLAAGLPGSSKPRVSGGSFVGRDIRASKFPDKNATWASLISRSIFGGCQRIENGKLLLLKDLSGSDDYGRAIGNLPDEIVNWQVDLQRKNGVVSTHPGGRKPAAISAARMSNRHAPRAAIHSPEAASFGSQPAAENSETFVEARRRRSWKQEYAANFKPWRDTIGRARELRR